MERLAFLGLPLPVLAALVALLLGLALLGRQLHRLHQPDAPARRVADPAAGAAARDG